MTHTKRPLVVLNNVLWVPSQYVTSELEDEFTYKFDKVEYHENCDLPRQCSSCELWGKAWRFGKKTCEASGYSLDDICEKFSFKKLPVMTETIIKTYKRLNSEWSIFARGDLGKIERLFGEDFEIEDQRSAPKLGFKLKCTTPLYPEQLEVQKAWLEHGYGVVQAPTSWGKTLLWASLVAKLGLRTLLMSQEIRHLSVGWEGLYEHTNLAEIEEEAGVHLCGQLNHDWRWAKDDEGKPVRKLFDKEGAYYPLTFSTYQSFLSDRGLRLRKELKDYFGVVWAEECLTGDTLVPTTDRGIVRLDSLVDDTSQSQDLRVSVGTRFGVSNTSRWISKGVHPTLRIRTKLRNEIKATLEHKMLVLNPMTYDLVWVEAQNLVVGDLLCVSSTPVTRSSTLHLDLKDPDDVSQHNTVNYVHKPKEMTADLAFIIGCVVAEGGLYGPHKIEITNTDQALLDAYSDCLFRVFGKRPYQRLQYPKGSKVCIRGKSYVTSKDCYCSTFISIVASSWLESLGVRKVKSPKKTVPWSILQADRNSQLAFIAAYIECDGFISATGYIGICSASINLMREMQVLLFAHGVSSSEIKRPNKDRRNYYIRTSVYDSAKLYPSLAPRLVTKKLKIKKRRGSKLYGIPATGVLNLLQTRRLPSTKRKRIFADDAGNRVTCPGLPNELIYEYSDFLKIIPYETLESGTNEKLLTKISKVSKSMHEKLEEIVRHRYRFVAVTSIRSNGDCPVFDLTMADSNDRSFIANGLVSSNCHHEAAATFHQVTKSFNPFYRGGQTATPSRKDQAQVVIFDTLGPVTAKGVKEAMTPKVFFRDTQVLVPPSVFHGMYIIPRINSYLARNAAYIEFVSEQIISDIEAGRKPLLITERRNFAGFIQKRVESLGYKVALIMSREKMKEQDWYARAYMSGEISLIIGTSVVDENINIPPIDSVHLPFPNFTKEREEQRIGRARRFLSGSNKRFMEENEIEWEKPQPHVNVYVWHASHNIASSAVGFRRKLYKKWGFEFADPPAKEPEYKRPKTMRDWLDSVEAGDDTKL